MIVAITDRTVSFRRNFIEQVEKIVEARPDVLILREKDLSLNDYEYLAAECMRICESHNVRFCVNTFIDVAEKLNVDAVNVSYGSLATNKKRLERFKEVWVSVHSEEEAISAEGLGATHIIYGNVFETSCKPGAKGRGPDALRDICKHVNIPVLAVGGIDYRNIGSVMMTGCAGVCIRSLFMESAEPRDIMKLLLPFVSKK